VLGEESWDHIQGYQRRSLVALLQPRYDEVAPLGKPVIIAELGVSGSPDEQADWLARGAQDLAHFPLLRAAILFNDRNAANNLMKVQPNWRLGSSTLSHLLRGETDGRLIANHLIARTDGGDPFDYNPGT